MCLTGYTGDNCEIDIDECAIVDCGEGTCQDEVGTYSCVCLTGFTGLNCEENIDDCVDVECEIGVCHDQVNGYNCIGDGKSCTYTVHSSINSNDRFMTQKSIAHRTGRSLPGLL